MRDDEFVMRARQLATLVLASSPRDVLALLRPGEILLAEVLPEEKRLAHESQMSGITADIQRRASSRKRSDEWNLCKAAVIAWLREEAAIIDDAIDPDERPASEGAHALLVAAHKMEHGDPGNPDCPWNMASYVVYFSPDPLPIGAPREYFTQATSHVADLVGTFTAADEDTAIQLAVESARQQWGVLGAGGYFAAFPVDTVTNDTSLRESGGMEEPTP